MRFRNVPRGYLLVKATQLAIDTPLGYDLYARSRTGAMGLIKLYSKGEIISSEARQSLARYELFIPLRAQASLMDNDVGAIPANVRQPHLYEQAKHTYESAAQLTQSIMMEPSDVENLEQVSIVVEDLVQCILDSDEILYQLSSLASHDYYTHTHSVNVCIYSLGLAYHLGNRDPEFLRELGIGGLLHDIGKRAIDTAILTKRGPLTDKEWVKVKRHPRLGAELVGSGHAIPPASVAMVLLHHERYHGGGYPLGLSGDLIPLVARIAVIADVYDALTTNRSYSESLIPPRALKIMLDEMPDHFDRPLLLAFLRFIHQSQGEKWHKEG